MPCHQHVSIKLAKRVNSKGSATSLPNGNKKPKQPRLSKPRLSITSLTSMLPKMKIFSWFLEPQFYLIACIYMSTRLFVNISQSYISFYLQYTITLPAEYVAVIPLVMYISGFFVSLILKFATSRYGYKICFVASCVVGLGMLR